MVYKGLPEWQLSQLSTGAEYVRYPLGSSCGAGSLIGLTSPPIALLDQKKASA
jgi:hypothetical protein